MEKKQNDNLPDEAASNEETAGAEMEQEDVEMASPISSGSRLHSRSTESHKESDYSGARKRKKSHTKFDDPASSSNVSDPEIKVIYWKPTATGIERSDSLNNLFISEAHALNTTVTHPKYDSSSSSAFSRSKLPAKPKTSLKRKGDFVKPRTQRTTEPGTSSSGPGVAGPSRPHTSYPYHHKDSYEDLASGISFYKSQDDSDDSDDDENDKVLSELMERKLAFNYLAYNERYSQGLHIAGDSDEEDDEEQDPRKERGDN